MTKRQAPSRTEFLVFGQPDIGDDEINEVTDSLRRNWLGTGPKVAQFERDFAAYKGVPAAVAVNSCTAGLHLALLAAGVGPGDEVITTPLTFCATANVIVHAGATPVIADVDPATMNIDPKAVERKLTKRTKALLPVHFAGRACDMDALMAIANDRKLKVIEDCAHAVETEYKGRKAGTFGDFAAFSFYATKNMTTGEGGMVFARDPAGLARVRTLSLHGLSKDAWKRFSDSGYQHYAVTDAGYKYNMMDIQAALGLHQLKRVETMWKRREVIWRAFMKRLADLPLDLPAPVEPKTRHAYHLFTPLIDEKRAGLKRDDVLNGLTAHKIGCGVHYVALTDHPHYQKTFGWKPADAPAATDIGRRTLSLPNMPRMTDQDIDDVVAALHQVMGQKVKLPRAS